MISPIAPLAAWSLDDFMNNVGATLGIYFPFVMLIMGFVITIWGIWQTSQKMLGAYGSDRFSWVGIFLRYVIGGAFLGGGFGLLNPTAFNDESTDQQPAPDAPAVPAVPEAPAAPATPMDWNQFAPLGWVLGILMILSLLYAGTRVAMKARKKHLAAKRKADALAAKWAAAAQRATAAQQLQAGYEGIPMGDTTDVDAWLLAFKYPEFTNVAQQAHRNMIAALSNMDAMRERLRVANTKLAGNITMTGSEDELEQFLRLVAAYELSIETNIQNARRLGDTQLDPELQRLIRQSQQILSQIGEGTALKSETVSSLLEKLDKNISRINQLHGSDLVRPAVARMIADKATTLRQLTAGPTATTVEQLIAEPVAEPAAVKR